MALFDLNNFDSGWGWVLWFGFVFLFFSNFGNWGYTHRAHPRFDERFSSVGGPRKPPRQKGALEILNERYARGEIDHDDYFKMIDPILPDIHEDLRKSA